MHKATTHDSVSVLVGLQLAPQTGRCRVQERLRRGLAPPSRLRSGCTPLTARRAAHSASAAAMCPALHWVIAAPSTTFGQMARPGTARLETAAAAVPGRCPGGSPPVRKAQSVRTVLQYPPPSAAPPAAHLSPAPPRHRSRLVLADKTKENRIYKPEVGRRRL